MPILVVGQRHKKFSVVSFQLSVNPKDKSTGLKTGHYSLRTVRRSMRFSYLGPWKMASMKMPGV